MTSKKDPKKLPFEMPTNTDLEKVLKQNLDRTKPVEIKEYESGGEKLLFPFWTPVKDPAGVTFTDYKAYLDEKSKKLGIMQKKDNVGIVQPKINVSKTYEDTSLLDKIQAIIDKQNAGTMTDKSGAVKPKAENMPSKTTKQVTKNEVGKPKEVKVEKSAKSKTGVGAVTPKAENMPKGTTTPITDNKVGVPKEVKVEKAAKSRTGVGAVQPKAENMPKGTTTPITDNKVGVPKEVKVEKAAKSKTGVGAVTPQADMGKQTKVDVTAGAQKASGEKVGAVKPKAEQMSTKTEKQVTDNKVDKPKEPVVKKAEKSKTGVGAVTPKAAMGKQNTVGNINFDKYKTDHIAKP